MTFLSLVKSIASFLLRPDVKNIKKVLLETKEEILIFVQDYEWTPEEIKSYEEYVYNPNKLLSFKDGDADQVCAAIFSKAYALWSKRIIEKEVMFLASLLNEKDYESYLQTLYDVKTSMSKTLISILGIKLATLIDNIALQKESQEQKDLVITDKTITKSQINKLFYTNKKVTEDFN